MHVQRLVPTAPLGTGLRNGVINMADYEGKDWPMAPIAIPSKNRECTLCEQTLQMLRSYGYNMAKVHVFVDATHFREDGSNEYDMYWRCLRSRGFSQVNIHPGGKGLRKQYARIFAFFHGEPEIIMSSDTVPRLHWRKRLHNVSVEPLPAKQFKPVIRIGFDMCRVFGARAWSLASCKAGPNLTPGRISRKCGLLCGNFFGVRMDVGRPIQMTVSDLTTDVEFSLKCWKQDGAMLRFLGIAAAHEYRSRGGHADIFPQLKKRHVATCKAIETLARQFPETLKYTGTEERRSKAMNYRFLQKGPKALVVKGTFTAQGRKPANGWRHVSGKERVRRHRLRQRQTKKNGHSSRRE